MTPAARITSSGERAADELALARCDREQRCDRLGREGYYASREHCLRAMLTGLQFELNTCGNVDPTVLESCVAETRAFSCEANIDRLDRIAPCGRLCVP